MTATLKKNGQIAIPADARSRHKLGPGTKFTVLTRRPGEILLRKVKTRRHHATLTENLRALSGLQLVLEKSPSRDLNL